MDAVYLSRGEDAGRGGPNEPRNKVAKNDRAGVIGLLKRLVERK